MKQRPHAQPQIFFRFKSPCAKRSGGTVCTSFASPIGPRMLLRICVVRSLWLHCLPTSRFWHGVNFSMAPAIFLKGPKLIRLRVLLISCTSDISACPIAGLCEIAIHAMYSPGCLQLEANCFHMGSEPQHNVVDRESLKHVQDS